jgi:hypothetical protein
LTRSDSGRISVSSGNPKLLPCVFFDDVMCSFRKDEKVGVLGRCFSCRHYLRFMADMDKQEEEEDSAFLAESERMYRFAKCLFEDCLCDGKFAKLACFGGELVGGRVVAWVCKRFVLDKLPSRSAMRDAYLDLLGRAVANE